MMGQFAISKKLLIQQHHLKLYNNLIKLDKIYRNSNLVNKFHFFNINRRREIQAIDLRAIELASLLSYACFDGFKTTIN